MPLHIASLQATFPFAEKKKKRDKRYISISVGSVENTEKFSESRFYNRSLQNIPGIPSGASVLFSLPNIHCDT